MTDFNLQTMMDILTQTLFGGNAAVAGMAFLVITFLIIVVVFARMGAPVQYSIVPMIPISIFFTYLGIVDATVSMLIIIISVVIVAMFARGVVEG